MRKNREFYCLPGDPAAKKASLQAALELFVSEGISATSIRDIAERTGYTNPAIFKHFPSKEALAAYLFERCYDWIASNIVDAASHEESYAGQMRAALACSLRLMDENLEAMLYVQENLRRFWDEVPPAVRRLSLVSHLRNLVRLGIQEGAVSGDPDLLTAAIIGLISQIARMRHFGEFSGRAIGQLDALEELVVRMSRGTTTSEK